MGFQVLMQTNFTDPAVVYDSDQPSQPTTGIDWSNMFMSVVKPVIQVQVEGTPVYSTGAFYEPQGKFWLIGFGVVALIGVAALVGKLSK